MATKEQIEYVFSNIVQSQPSKLMELLSGASEGIGCVLKLLCDAKEPISCKELSERMGVSPARVAVLVKKLVSRGLVVRETSTIDGRVACVKLTDKGKQTAFDMQMEMNEHISSVIDEIGMQKIEQFIALSGEIKKVAEDKIAHTVIDEF